MVTLSTGKVIVTRKLEFTALVVIKNSLVPVIESALTGISARVMRLRVPVSHGRRATLFSCYASTLSSLEDDKDAFYEQLVAELQRIPETDKLIVLGDFNARVGSDHRAWAGVVGRHGVGKINANGHRLLSLCSQNQLIVTNTILQTKN